MDSILISIKKLLGPTIEYDYFDSDIIMHINSVFMILNQLGVGPDKCFTIQDDTAVWSDFVQDDTTIEAVKTYIYLKVKLIFDPPVSGIVLEAFNRNIDELEWRLHLAAETKLSNLSEDKEAIAYE